MRNVLWIAVLAACGGSATPPPQQPQPPPPQLSSSTPPAPEPAPTPATGLDKSVCAQRAESFGPIPLNEAQLAQRRGTGVTRFDAITTTKDTPIEVCEPSGQRAWLQSATCADGSRPTSAQRGGSVGPGGTCGSIIDVYEVVCPEKTYAVFMDMYMCPASS